MKLATRGYRVCFDGDMAPFHRNGGDEGFDDVASEIAVGIEGSIEAGGIFLTASYDSKDVAIAGIQSDGGHLTAIGK